jgi:hypothetical protein
VSEILGSGALWQGIALPVLATTLLLALLARAAARRRRSPQ